MKATSAALVGFYIDRAIDTGAVVSQEAIAKALELAFSNPYAWRNQSAPSGWISPMRIPAFARAVRMTQPEMVELLLTRLGELSDGQNVKANKESLVALTEAVVPAKDPEQWIKDAIDAATDAIGYRYVLNPTPEAIDKVRRLAIELVTDAVNQDQVESDDC